MDDTNCQYCRDVEKQDAIMGTALKETAMMEEDLSGYRPVQRLAHSG